MMSKIGVQFIALVGSFFLIWFVLSRIDWVSLLNVKETTNKTEEKVGELFLEMIERNEDIIEADSLVRPFVNMLDQLKEANDIDSEINLHLVHKDEINAFAMPGDNIILFSGLIEACESPEEVAGVIGHEMAHLEKNHVMKKLIKEVGLAVLISMTSGSNSTVIQEALSTLTSSAYDRSLESEADLTALEYLKNAEIDPTPFAEFLFRLSLEESELQGSLELLSTHPGSEDRAKAIMEQYGDGLTSRPLMTVDRWKSLQQNLENY